MSPREAAEDPLVSDGSEQHERHPSSAAHANGHPQERQEQPSDRPSQVSSLAPRPSANGQGEAITIRGARVHNLRGVDVDLPRNQLIVITGPSGSGKSSLAFDTLFAEGQRQYIESLSVYSRQFLHQLERPEVDHIEGLQPTICIDQRIGTANPRSTVGTVTEIYDYLRLLYARLGTPHCPECSEPICQQTSEQIHKQVMSLPEQAKTMILAPLVRGRKGAHAEIFAQIRQAGFLRARVDGTVYELDQLPELSSRKQHTIEAVVDRIIIRESSRARVGESLRLALAHGEGQVLITHFDHDPTDETGRRGRWLDRRFSTQYACPSCQVSLEEIEPRTFSFNSPYGACPVCDGIGHLEEFDPELVLPNHTLSISEGALSPWKQVGAAAQKKLQKAIHPFLNAFPQGDELPLEKFPADQLHQLIYGDEDQYVGLLLLLEKEFATTTSAKRRKELEAYRGLILCQRCQGTRLRSEARSVQLAERSIDQVVAMSVDAALAHLQGISFEEEDDQQIAAPLLPEICKRLAFLQKVGLDYLTLDRPADTLSGGELQRVRLATGIGSGLVGVCYVLDEPTIGLHSADSHRLIEALRELQELGNTVLVVEHDEAMIRQADLVLDIGPGAGTRGGMVVAQGTPEEVANNPDSPTGRFLSGRQQISRPADRRRTAKSRSLILTGASHNNLQSVEVQVPLGALVCVSGPSGSGKSSLVNETLARAVVRRLGGVAPKPGPFTSLRGVSQLDRVINIDQAPIGRTPRSNAATYCGLFDEIRKLYAQTRTARQRGFAASRFSFNVKGGRCETCQGQGEQKIEMNFLPDLHVPCETCRGARFNRQTLAVRYRERSIAEVLDMAVDEAVEFFQNISSIERPLSALSAVGLGYLPLGQPSTTLSGGEAQRVKLAAQLARVETGQTLYLLDEPTTGLHFEDIERLLQVLSQLVDRGNTVLVIEHQLDIIKCADWVIDLGPAGGDRGGEVVAQGTPEQVAQVAESPTGQFLRSLLADE